MQSCNDVISCISNLMSLSMGEAAIRVNLLAYRNLRGDRRVERLVMVCQQHHGWNDEKRVHHCEATKAVERRVLGMMVGTEARVLVVAVLEEKGE